MLFNFEELLNADPEFLTGVACSPLLNFHTNLHTKSGVACYPRPNPIEALELRLALHRRRWGEVAYGDCTLLVSIAR